MSTASTHSRTQLCLASVKVQREDVMTVQTALRRCDIEQLLSCVLWGQLGWRLRFDMLSETTKDALYRKMESLIELMLSFEAESCSDESILIPLQSFSLLDERGLIGRNVGAVIFERDGASAAEQVIYLGQGRKYSLEAFKDGARMIGGADLIDALAVTGCLIDVSSCIDLSWPEVLGKQVWLPHELSETERHSVLSHIIWAMTYHGFGETWHEADDDSTSADLHETFPYDAVVNEKLYQFIDLLNYDAQIDSIEAALKLLSSEQALS